MREWLPDVVLIIGVAAIAVGAGLLALWLGIVVAGVELALLGFVLGAGPDAPRPPEVT